MSLPSFPSPSTPSSAPVTPSKVIHFRNVGENINQADLYQLCQQYGAVSNILMLKTKNQALVQFQELAGAQALIAASSKYLVSIGKTPIYPQYSTHAELSTPQKSSASGPESSRILLITILNPFYNITVEVLSEIFSRYDTSGRGTVEKIVIFQKTAGLQALVQFSSVENAVTAKNAVDGKNIYSNCCTLQIQFSNLSDLTVKENSEKSRDYTNPSLPTRQSTPSILGPSATGSRPSRLMGMGSATMPMAGVGMGSMTGERSVLLVSGFPPAKVGCEQLFNLFSNYGLILRVKILYNKPNMALIQFSDAAQAQQALEYLRNVRLFGSSLEINYSKYTSVTPGPSRSAAGTANTVDYESSPLNRFIRYRASNLRNMSHPTDTLHISSLNSSTTPEQLKQHLTTASQVLQVKVYEHNQKTMALAQFASVEAAVEAMCLLHNSTLNRQRINLSFTRNHF